MIFGIKGCMPFPFTWDTHNGISKLIEIVEEQEKEVIFKEAGFMYENTLPSEPIYESDWKTVRVGVTKWLSLL